MLIQKMNDLTWTIYVIHQINRLKKKYPYISVDAEKSFDYNNNNPSNKLTVIRNRNFLNPVKSLQQTSYLI